MTKMQTRRAAHKASCHLLALLTVASLPLHADNGAPLTCQYLPGSASDVPFGFWGLAANQVLPGGNTVANHAMLAPLIRSTRATRVRVNDLRWNLVQPTSGPPNWGDLASIYQIYRDRGLTISVSIRGTPAWASADPSCVPGECDTEPPDLDAWTDFVTAAALNFEGLVDAWQIWNEPNNVDFFTGTPEEYVEMLNAAYTAIKEAVPSAEVWAPDTISLCSPPRPFEDKVAESGLFDVFATHIYCYQGTQQKLVVYDDVRTILDSNGHIETPLRITETNETVSGCDIDPDIQADVLEELYSCFAIAGADAVFWWKATDTCGCPAAMRLLGDGLVQRPEIPDGGVICPDRDDVRENGIINTQYEAKPAHGRYRELVERTALFVDGFESGDTSRWSEVEPN